MADTYTELYLQPCSPSPDHRRATTAPSVSLDSPGGSERLVLKYGLVWTPLTCCAVTHAEGNSLPFSFFPFTSILSLSHLCSPSIIPKCIHIGSPTGSLSCQPPFLFASLPQHRAHLSTIETLITRREPHLFTVISLKYPASHPKWPSLVTLPFFRCSIASHMMFQPC